MTITCLPAGGGCRLNWPHRLVARTSGSHPENRGSIPLGATEKEILPCAVEGLI